MSDVVFLIIPGINSRLCAKGFALADQKFPILIIFIISCHR
jgi:hypothetical protein